VLGRHTWSYRKSLPRPCASDGKLGAVTFENEPTLRPDTIVPCGWSSCDVPVRLGRLICAAHLDEMNIAAQLSTDWRRPDCGEPLLFAVLLHECGASPAIGHSGT
jgi:hypothetical protein